MLGAVIFDFDGIITDSEILHYHTFSQVFAPYGIELTLKDYYREYLGLSDYDLFGHMIDVGLLKVDKSSVDELVRQKNLLFEELAAADGKIIDGVREFIDMLRHNDVPMAICSGALLSEIELILDGAGLRDMFEVIVSAEQVKKGKPDPEGFLLSLGRLNKDRPEPIRPEECIVIEDSHWGLDAAVAAGMHTVAVTNSYDADLLRSADKVVDHLDELKIDDLHKLVG